MEQVPTCSGERAQITPYGGQELDHGLDHLDPVFAVIDFLCMVHVEHVQYQYVLVRTAVAHSNR